MDEWLDKRDRKMILEKVGELARSYTPEWQFAPDKPDAGGTIAMVFANQTADTIKKMNLLLDKYQIEFVNMYGVSVRPAAPASTVAVMTLSESRQEGTALEKGMQVAGQNEQGDEILYELQSDLYVTTARIKAAFLVTHRDNIVIPCRKNLPLFDYSHGKRKHEALYLHFRQFSKDSGICLKLTKYRNASFEPAELLADTDAFTISYRTAEGVFPFQSVSHDRDILILRTDKDTEIPPAFVIVIEPERLPVKDIRVSDIRIVMNPGHVCPDLILTDTDELDREKFLPFGRQFSVYQSCYIGQEGLFKQAGAEVTLKFNLSFERFSTRVTPPKDTDLRMIKRKKKHVYSPPPQVCLIQEISLEYFNGIGYKKLDCSGDIRAVFSGSENEGQCSIRFTVPEDWEDTRQCGYEQNFLRMQVLRADNCYLQEVEFCYPVITDMEFEIHDSGIIRPIKVEKETGGKITDLTWQLLHGQAPVCFSKNPYDGNYFLIGFDRKPKQGPVSVFFELLERMICKDAKLFFAYSAPFGFRELRVADRTDNLQHSGIITFMPPSDMKSMEIEGVNAFWIRIEDRQNFGDEDTERCPVLKKMYLNAVSVINYEWMKEQNYYIDTVSKNMKFPLYCDHVISAQVWVNELEVLSAAEMAEMEKNCRERVRAEYSLTGRVEEFYVLWDEVKSFDTFHDEVKRSGWQKRVYRIDRYTGEIIFGNGKNAYMPCHTRGIAFKVKVLTCSGEKGNLPKGAIDRFRENIFTIDEITNPVAAYGGADMESSEDALIRGSLTLSARKRLVAKRDYEREALVFSDAIDKVSCVVGAHIDTVDGKTIWDKQSVSLVLLMKDYRKGSYSFRNICGRLKDHICTHCQITCDRDRLSVTEPVFVHICVKAWCEIRDMTKSMEIKKEILAVIDNYLEPAGPNGWPIGHLPVQEQMEMLLGTLEGMVHISARMFSVTYTDSGGRHETDLDDVYIRTNPFAVCCSGEHEIYFQESF